MTVSNVDFVADDIIRGHIDSLRAEIAKLAARVADLEARADAGTNKEDGDDGDLF